MTQQTFAILPKIREVDSLLQNSERARRSVREVHPEIRFWALGGRSPSRHRKKTGGGFRERLVLLEGFRPSVGEDFARIRTQFRCWDLADDDILDAMAAAITALADLGALKTLPEQPTTDSRGLPMEMVYAADAASATSRVGCVTSRQTPAYLTRFSRCSSTTGPITASRQERQIVQSWLDLDDFLP